MTTTMSKFLSGGKSYTLNFDGSHNNQAQKAGAGCVIRDNQGNLIAAASYNLTNSYPYNSMNVAIAEATALKNGLNLAKLFNIKLDLIKGDSKEVIDHVNGTTLRPPKPPLSDIIADIKASLLQHPFSNVELIDREANKAADNLAYFGSQLDRGSLIYTTEDDLPPQVADIIRLEKPPSSGGASSSTTAATAIGMAGAAAAGVAVLTWGVSKLFFGGGDSDAQSQHQGKAKAPLSPWDLFNANMSNFTPKDDKFYVLHVDGLDSNQLEKAAAGCIIRDKQGEFVVAAAYNLDYCYPTCHIGIAEAMALKKGLELANDHNIKVDLIKVDNKEVFDRVLGRDNRPPKVSRLIEIVQEIRSALYEQSIDREKQLVLVKSTDNVVADELAQLGRRLNRQMKTFRGVNELSSKIANLIKEEKFNWHL